MMFSSNMAGCGRKLPSSGSRLVRQARSARITLIESNESVRIEYVIGNAAMVDELLIRPLNASHIDDPMPSVSEIGVIELFDDNGQPERIVLALPWGKILRPGEVRSADLTELKKLLTRYNKWIDETVIGRAQ